jgi:hypothetical protein
MRRPVSSNAAPVTRPSCFMGAPIGAPVAASHRRTLRWRHPTIGRFRLWTKTGCGAPPCGAIDWTKVLQIRQPHQRVAFERARTVRCSRGRGIASEFDLGQAAIASLRALCGLEVPIAVSDSAANARLSLAIAVLLSLTAVWRFMSAQVASPANARTTVPR